jgi:hypothetical protein
MFLYNSNFSVNKPIDNVFKLIYEVPEDYSVGSGGSGGSSVSTKDNDDNEDDDNDNDDDNDSNDSRVALDMKDSTNINSDLYKILEWNINNNWDIINGRRRKIESAYLYINDFPKYLKEVVVEDDNYIRLRRKHTIVNDGEKYKVIITKNKITNLKLGYLYIIKALCTLKIVKIKEKVSLTYINDKETRIDVAVKVNIPIIINDELEKYLNVVFQSVLNNIKNKIVS